MKVVVATEARLIRHEDGTLHAPTQGRAYPFWTRYLDGFSEVGILARVADAPGVGGHPVEGPGVEVLPVTDFVGLRGLVQKGLLARADVHRWVNEVPDDALIGRLPGVLGRTLLSYAKRSERPYAIEVVGDPQSAVLTAGLAGRASRAMAYAASADMRRQIRGAGAVSYVTRNTLQLAYPPSSEATVASYSSVELPDEAFRAPNTLAAPSVPFHLVMVGTMRQAYKGHDILLRAMAHLAQQGLATRATLVGEGRLRDAIEQDAQALALDVSCVGQLGSPEEVRAVLDTADLFVMPSRSEGLPRALIEAMARGLPAVGSEVGGIPELLEPESLVPAGQPVALARAIHRHLQDDQFRRHQASRNHAVAHNYHQDRLANERKLFYAVVRDQVEQQRHQAEER